MGDDQSKRHVLDGYNLYTYPQYPTELEEVPFKPLSYEEYMGPYAVLDSYTPLWRPLIEIACEKTFRGLLGGEKAGEGWFFDTKRHYKHFKIVELSRPGVGVYLSPYNSDDDEEQIWVEFFSDRWLTRADDIFPSPEAKDEIFKFALITRTMIAEMFRGGLSEHTLVLAGRIGSPVHAPRMIEHDQLDFLTITDWDRGLGQFVTGERVYSLRAAYADQLNALLPERVGNAEPVTLRARKTRAVTTFLEMRYPTGVPDRVSGGALCSEVATWFREQGFDDGVSDKTVYRVRRSFNASRQRPDDKDISPGSQKSNPGIPQSV